MNCNTMKLEVPTVCPPGRIRCPQPKRGENPPRLRASTTYRASPGTWLANRLDREVNQDEMREFARAFIEAMQKTGNLPMAQEIALRETE